MGEAKRRGDLDHRIALAKIRRAEELAKADLEADRQYAERQRMRAAQGRPATNGVRHSRKSPMLAAAMVVAAMGGMPMGGPSR